MSAPGSPGLVASGRHVFSDAELDAIEQSGDRMALITAPMGGGRQDNSKRITKVAGFEHTEENKWIYERIARAVGLLNQNYRFNLTTFREVFQFMVYRDVEGGHFNWHIDQGPTVTRKLSLTLQLTDPARYQGCELQFNNGADVWSAPKERGTLIAFPSNVLHRVTPITKGIRKALVAWVADK